MVRSLPFQSPLATQTTRKRVIQWLFSSTTHSHASKIPSTQRWVSFEDAAATPAASFGRRRPVSSNSSRVAQSKESSRHSKAPPGRAALSGAVTAFSPTDEKLAVFGEQDDADADPRVHLFFFACLFARQSLPRAGLASRARGVCVVRASKRPCSKDRFFFFN